MEVGTNTPEKNPKQQSDVVSIELPAPSGWTKKCTPKRSRGAIVFISPTGEEIKSKRQLEQYLKSHPECPSASEFDWGTGDTPRRSARLSGKSKATDSPGTETPKKKQKISNSKKGRKEKNDADEEGEAADEDEDNAEQTKESTEATMEEAEDAAKHADKKEVSGEVLPEKDIAEDTEQKTDAGEEYQVVTEEPGEEYQVVTEEPGEEYQVVFEEPGEEYQVVTEEPGEQFQVVTEEPGEEYQVVIEEPGEEYEVVIEEPGEVYQMMTEEPGEVYQVVTEDPGPDEDKKDATLEHKEDTLEGNMDQPENQDDGKDKPGESKAPSYTWGDDSNKEAESAPVEPEPPLHLPKPYYETPSVQETEAVGNSVTEVAGAKAEELTSGKVEDQPNQKASSESVEAGVASSDISKRDEAGNQGTSSCTI